jgi:hypothetical protein
MEYHVVNASDEPVDAEAALNLWRAKGPITGEAGVLFFYHTRIAIPPLSRATARMRWGIPGDVELIMIVPHMHRHATGMQAFRDTGNGTPSKLVDVQGWEVPNQVLDPPVHFAKNDILDFQCDYDNPTSSYIFDGFSARNNEMCVAASLYYRPNADRLPLQDEYNFGGGIVYSGTNSCTQIQACQSRSTGAHGVRRRCQTDGSISACSTGVSFGADTFHEARQLPDGPVQDALLRVERRPDQPDSSLAIRTAWRASRRTAARFAMPARQQRVP